MHERIRDVLLGHWGRFVSSHPRLVLVLCLALAVASVVLTGLRLEFKTDRSDLVDPSESWNRRYASYKEQFPRWDDVVVCFEGPPEDESIDRVVREVAGGVMSLARVRAAECGFDTAEAGPSLFLAADDVTFDRVLAELAVARRLAGAVNANAALELLVTDLGANRETASGEQLELILAPYLDAITGRSATFRDLLAPPSRWEPFRSRSGRIRYLLVQFATHERSSSVNTVGEDLAALRNRIAEIVATSDRPDVAWGATGVPAIEADETTQSIRDSTLASIVAFVLITLFMVSVFRGAWVPLLAAAALLIGLAWSFGWLMVSVGHLQVLSVVFSAMLLGLGVDFALHLVARLELVQDEHEHLADAIARVFRGIGPGMITGAVTTAAAFGMTALTDFRGMAEMGVIASGGIILCLVAVLSAFPAMLALTGRWKRIIRHREGGEEKHFAHGRFDLVDRFPRATIVVAVGVTALLGLAAAQTRYDPNVLNLHPPDIESVVWEKRIVEDDERSLWAAVVLTSGERAPELVDRLRALEQVSDVGGMGELLPRDRAQRAEQLAALRDTEVPTLTAPPGHAYLVRTLANLEAGIRVHAARPGTAGADELLAIADRIARARAAAAARSTDELEASCADLDRSFEAAIIELRDGLDAALGARLREEDLPAALRMQLIGEDGSWKLQVYPLTDPEGRSILHPNRLGPFVESVRAVAPQAAGPPVQILESSRLIQRSYTLAAAYAVAAILVILLLDFRSLADTLCAMAPVTIGFVGAFGLMALADVPVNFANIIVMPLIFGIGVDAGVHMVHRWRAQPDAVPAGLSGATGRGITLMMLTTMIGFGSMLLAQHAGIRSLAFVMLAGLSVTLVACYTLLPALLRLRSPHPNGPGT
jgi:hopanoid biosynthesis associated RND transporter like protein HpnN